MSLRPLLAFVLTLSHAATPPSAKTPPGTFADLTMGLFEQALATPMTGSKARAWLFSRYTSPADRAYVESLNWKAMPPFQARTFERRGEVYTITAPNGRTFTLTSTDRGQTVRVNGVSIAWNTLSLKATTDQVNAALHRTFVVHHPMFSLFEPSEARAFLPPLLGVMGLIAVLSWRYAFGSTIYDQLVDVAQKAERLCQTERQDPTITFANSTTAVNLQQIRTKYAEYKNAGKVPSWCKIGLPEDDIPKDVGNPRYDSKELRRTCGAARAFVTCAEAYRRDQGETTPEPTYQPSGWSSSTH